MEDIDPSVGHQVADTVLEEEDIDQAEEDNG